MSLRHILTHNRHFVFFGKASISIHRQQKGSVTVEAALAVPVFFLAVVSLLYLMEIMAVQTAVRTGLQDAGKQVAAESYPLAVLTPAQVENDVVSSIGAERLERSIVEGGSSGIQCQDSYLSATTGIGELVAEYEVRLPIPVFSVPPVKYRESIRIKAWTGYEKSLLGAEDEDTVYITETGLVYHKDYHCTYLELSIRMVQASEISSLRNDSGGKYYACVRCGGTDEGVAYITGTGDRYHSSLSCSGLKRTVYAVPVSEAAGKGACSRCSS